GGRSGLPSGGGAGTTTKKLPCSITTPASCSREQTTIRKLGLWLRGPPLRKMRDDPLGGAVTSFPHPPQAESTRSASLPSGNWQCSAIQPGTSQVPSSTRYTFPAAHCEAHGSARTSFGPVTRSGRTLNPASFLARYWKESMPELPGSCSTQI